MSKIVNTSLKTALKGTAIIFFSMIASVVLWVVTKMIIARNITNEELGLYSLATAVISIIAVIADMGVQNGIARYISVLLGEGKGEEAMSAAKASLEIGMLAGFASWLVIFIFADVIAANVFYKPDIGSVLRVISFYVPFVVISFIMGGILRGYGVIQGKVYFLDIGQPLLFMTFLVCCLILKAPFISIIYSYSFSVVAVSAGIFLYGYRSTGFNPFLTKGRHYSGLLSSSLPLMASSVMVIIFSWTDTIMLGRYADAKDVGIYNIAVLLAGMLTLPSIAMSYVFMPIAGDLYGKKQPAELKRIYQVLTKWIFAMTFPVFFILFFYPEMVITFLFGERFVLAALPLRILAFGFLLQTFMGVSNLMITVYGMSKDIMRVSVSGVVFNVLLNYLFLKFLGYGTIGAATATMLSYVLINVVNSVLLYRKSGIHPFTPNYLKPILSTLAAGIVIWLAVKGMPFSMWLMPAYLALFLACYVISFLLTRSVDSEDVFMLELFVEKTGIGTGLLSKVGSVNPVRKAPKEQ